MFDQLTKRAAVALSVLAVVAAACSSDGATSDTTPPTQAPTTTAQATTPPVTVREATTADVLIPVDGLELSATLRLPAASEPVPAVVLIHGSGPLDRDARIPGQVGMVFGFEIPVFAEIAEALQDQGFAVATYDKRSCGPFNGCAQNDYPLPGDDLVIDTFLDDAAGVVAWLRQQDTVNPDDIVVVGHSQGAQFVPVMLAADEQLAGGVMIAGPYRAVDEIVEAQRDLVIGLLEQLGMSNEEAVAWPSVAPITEMVEGLAGLRLGNNEPVAGVSAGFWRSWFDLGDRAVAAASAISQPLLILNGDLDWNVPVSEAELWQEHLGATDVGAAVVTLPCITHALNCVSESEPSAMQPSDIGKSVAAEVVAALATFLQQTISDS